MKKVRAVTKTLGIHTTLILTILISSVPFYWAAQNSIKFTRDTISKTPTLWGFDVTADPYRKFWFRDEEQNMWQVALFCLALSLVVSAVVRAGRRAETTWPWNTGVVLTLWIALQLFPKFFDMNREFDYFLNSVFVTVLTVIAVIAVIAIAGIAIAAAAVIADRGDGTAISSGGEEPNGVAETSTSAGEKEADKLVPASSTNDSEAEVSTDDDDQSTTDGPEPHTNVPGVVGLLEADARKQLEDDGFTVSVEPVDRPPGSPDVGVVVSQDPDGGLEAEPGAAVVIGVGRSTGISVPSVLSLSEADARIQLIDAGFEPIVEYLDRRPGSPDVDVVVNQEPDEGFEALPGSDIAIKVGRSTGLAETVWLVQGFNLGGQERDVVGGGILTISFGADGTVTGSGGCNLYQATYSENGNALTVDQRTSTLIACLGPVAEEELVFFVTLDNITSIRERGEDGLELITENGDAIIVIDDNDPQGPVDPDPTKLFPPTELVSP